MKRKGTIHLIKVGMSKTPTGYVPAFCGLIDGVMNKVTTEKSNVTCKKCISLNSQYEAKTKKEIQGNGNGKI